MSSAPSSTLERLLKRDRALALAALLAASLLAWTYLAAGAGIDMDSMAMPDMAMPAEWTVGYFALMLAMWAIMMVAMMLPSAAPMVLLYGTLERRRGGGSPLGAMALFGSAYLMVWSGFSLFAVLLQWRLDALALLSPGLATTSAAVAAAILVAAGLYQFTPLKQACLRACRSPLDFISRHWSRGPFWIGLRHGLYCLGCCWMLMLLLFVGGVMNLAWVALLAALVLAEKLAPRGRWIGYAGGVAFVAGGGWMLYARLLA